MRKTLWVVDDDQEMIHLYVELFQWVGGLDVVTFTDPAELLVAYDQAPEAARPRLVVTDNRMRSMRGTDLAAALRTRTPGLVILLVTGDSGLTCPHASEVIAKPFGTEEMISKISSYFSN